MIRQMATGVVKSVRSGGKDPVAVTGLESGANGLYRVEVDPAAYLPSGAFVKLLSDDTDLAMNFAIDAARVKDVDFPAFAKLGGELRDLLKSSKQVLGFEKKPAQEIYDGIDAIRRAGLLNIMRKCAATSLPNGRVVSSYPTELFELRGDRFFCGVPQALREDVKNSVLTGLFEPVPEGLHHPPVGFEHAGSFKTADHYGNLQLTFFANGDEWRADIDIDDAQGLEHVFQVLRNSLTGRPTHPYDIHEILLLHQKLDVGYQFEL
jgi:hypothetical protein